MKNILFIFIIINSIESICFKGCLRCNFQTNTCLICDTLNKYYLFKNETCLKSEILNCSSIDIDNKCLLCDNGYFLDSNKNLCQQIESSYLIKGCLNYSSFDKCVTCDTNLYLLNNSCTEVTSLIDNCILYNNDMQCSLCSNGYNLNIQGQCTNNIMNKNCLTYSYLQCNSCKAGYYIEPNNYILNSYNISNIQKNLQNIFNFYKVNNFYDVCSKNNIKNCSVQLTFNVCQECIKGYCLIKNQCSFCSKSLIENCLIYTNDVVCSVCNKGYLNTGSSCMPISTYVTIKDCLIYDPSSYDVKCSQCPTNYYLNSVGTQCIKRKNIDFYCISYDLFNDFCSQCDNNYVLSNSKLKCFLTIPNCQQYITNDLAQTILCIKCSNNYYYDVNLKICLLGNLLGCISYKSKLSCQQCDNSIYYLIGDLCYKHIPIPNCVYYDFYQQNVCKRCSSGYIAINFKDVCTPINEFIVDDCVKYNSIGSCVLCDTNYYLNNNNMCWKLSNKCLSSNQNGDCLQCDSLFKISNIDKKICVSVPYYITKNCEYHNPSSTIISDTYTSDDTCSYCKNLSYPASLKNNFICMNVLEELDNISNKIVNDYCNRYIYNSENKIFSCVSCVEKNIDNQYLFIKFDNSENLIDGTCITLPTSNYQLIKTFLYTYSNVLLVSNNVSTNYVIPSCLVAEIVFNFQATSLPFTKASCILWESSTVYLKYINSFYPIEENNFTADPFSNVSTDLYFFNGYKIQIINSPGILDKHLPATTSSSSSNSCELYYLSNSNYYCLRCKWGYSVSFNGTTTSCNQISNCNISVKKFGLNHKFNALLSCHSCVVNSNNYKLVISAVDTSVENIIQSTGWTTQVPSIQCYPSNTVSTSTSYLSINNCDIYYHRFTNLSTYSNDVNSNNKCVACSSGFISNNSQYDLVSCVSTSFSTIKSFNIPSKCDNIGLDTYAFSHDLNNCVQTSSNNCLIASSKLIESGLNKYYCFQCKPNYYLTIDKYCEEYLIDFSNNLSSNYIAFNITSLLFFKYALLIYKYSNDRIINGSESCEKDYMAVQLENQSHNICLYNSRPFSENVFNDSYSSSVYIQNCLNYSVSNILNNIFLCAICKNNYILNLSNTKCVPSISNCLKANDIINTKCSICDSNFALGLNGICYATSILNCSSYISIENGIRCNSCNDGYYLKIIDYTCPIGLVDGCAKYLINDPNTCISCQDLYYLEVVLSNSQVKCIITPDVYKCLNLSKIINYDTVLSFSCLTCSEGYFSTPYVVSNSVASSYCTYLPMIDNCLTYDTFTSLDSILSCTKCIGNYYLSNNGLLCNMRTFEDSNCLTFDSYSDNCLVCQNNYYYNASLKICETYPLDLVNCSNFDTNNICIECKVGYYLKNDVCLNINKTINNCKIYLDEENCQICNDGYGLKNNLCVIGISQNCKQYSNYNTCITCLSDSPIYILNKNQNGSIDCVQITTPNCIKTQTILDGTCILCNNNYYLDSNQECQLTTTISNCEIYLSNEACLKCKTNYMLSLDKKECISSNKIGLYNCDLLVNTTVAFCTSCNYGFILINGICTEIKSLYNISNCMIINTNTTSCYSCVPGSYQISNGTCISNNNSINYEYLIFGEYKAESSLMIAIINFCMIILFLI